MADPTDLSDIQTSERPHTLAIAVGVMVAIAALLYGWHLTSDLYADEIHTYQVVATGDFIEHLGDPVMVHPPLYFVCARLAYMAIGEPWAIRVPSILFSLAAIVLIAVGAKRILGARYVFPAAAIAATSPFMLEFATEGRPYALLIMLSIGMVIALHKFIAKETAWTTAGLACVAVLGLITHLAFLFTLIFAAVYYLAVRRKITKHAIIAVIAVTIVAGALLSFMIDDILFSNEATAEVREAHLSIPNFVARLPVALTYGYCTFSLGEIGAGRNVTSSMIRDNWALVGLVGVSFVGIAAAIAGGLIRRIRGLGFIILAVLVPIIVALIVGKVGFYYLREKYLAGVMGAYLLAVTAAMVVLARRKIGWIPLAAYIILVAISVTHYIGWPNEYSRRMDVTGLNATIDAQIAPGDRVVLYKPWNLHGAIHPVQMWHMSPDNPAIGFLRNPGVHDRPPIQEAVAFEASTSGTIFLISREATRNFVDPKGEVLALFGTTRTMEATRFGRNLTLYVLKRKATDAVATTQPQ